MDRSQLIEALNSSRAEMQAVMDGLDEQALLAPALENGWSVKDLLVHLSLWEAQLVTLLFQAGQGLRPTTLHFTPTSVDETNRTWHEHNRERPLAQALADWHGVRVQTLRRLEAFSDEQLFSPGHYTWAEGRCLADFVASDSFEHEREHAAQLRAWRKRQGPIG